jgi:hypothetical protein
MNLRSIAISLVLLAGCKTAAVTTQADATTTNADLTVDAAPTLAAPQAMKSCESTGECPSVLGCSDTCATQYDAHGKKTGGHCMLLAPGAGIGASPCFGEKMHNTTSFRTSNSQVAYGVLCDVDKKGAYCDTKTNVCVKVKSLGASCEYIEGECGVDGACHNGKCVRAAAVGASCKDIRCTASAECDDKTKTCVARKPLGAHCSFMDDCASLYCMNSRCAEQPATSGTCVLPR